MILTISTGSYMNELMDWIKHSGYSELMLNFDAINDNCFVTLRVPDGFSYNMAKLFEDIMLLQNHAACANERLRDVLSSVVFEPEKWAIASIIDEYIESSEHVNLEGFIAFRLSKYVHKLDLVLYAAVKNSLMYT